MGNEIAEELSTIFEADSSLNCPEFAKQVMELNILKKLENFSITAKNVSFPCGQLHHRRDNTQRSSILKNFATDLQAVTDEIRGALKKQFSVLIDSVDRISLDSRLTRKIQNISFDFEKREAKVAEESCDESNAVEELQTSVDKMALDDKADNPIDGCCSVSPTIDNLRRSTEMKDETIKVFVYK